MNKTIQLLVVIFCFAESASAVVVNWTFQNYTTNTVSLEYVSEDVSFRYPTNVPPGGSALVTSYTGTGKCLARYYCGFNAFGTVAHGNHVVQGIDEFYATECGGAPPLVNDGDDDDNCNADSCCGMPVWRVSEPYINLWLRDEPLGYQPALGPRVSFRLAFKQREATNGFNTNIFSVGKKWNFSWLSYVTQDTNTNDVVHFDGGRQRSYVGTNIDYRTNTRLTGDTTNGFTLSNPDGSQDVFGFVVTNNSGTFLYAFLTQRADPHGRNISLAYTHYAASTSPVVQLTNIVDQDGRTNTISYMASNAYSSNLISQVTDPFGRTATLLYDGSGHLTNIIDVAGLSSSVFYDTNDWPTGLTTPYGTTTFLITDTVPGDAAPNGRSVRVIAPDGGVQLFLHTNGVANQIDTTKAPDTSPFTNTLDTINLDLRDSFHWGPKQYAALSTTNIGALSTNDFLKGRMRHWLLSTSNFCSETLSMTRDASPDTNGAVAGQQTWCDYGGKSHISYEGTQVLPLFEVDVLPDGTRSFERTDRNLLGNVVTNTGTYSGGGGVAIRTNHIYTYDGVAGIDLISIKNASGVQITSNSYNSYHQVLVQFDALNAPTIYTYDGNQQLISTALPTGLYITNIYGTDNWLSTTFSFAIMGTNTNYFATNSYTYLNNLVLTHTDGHGLTTTSIWDNLQRLLRLNFSDNASFITNTYDKLDLVMTVDRMNFTNLFAYDPVRRLIWQTNANGIVTHFDYCACGSLNSVTQALGTPRQAVTQYTYNNQGKLTYTLYADYYTVTQNYNLLGQLTNTVDSFGVSVTNWFNNQGMKYAASNYFGQAFKYTFDILDRKTATVDANGVTVNLTHDDLDRLLTRTYPDTGVETFGYTLNVAGPTSYIDQVTKTNTYGYDARGLKTSENNANSEVTQFGYSPAGDLLTLTDAKTNTTTWTYDIYGLVSNKVDAAINTILVYHYDDDQRLTNRYSIAKGNTYYSYDFVGNLTKISYPVSTAISLAYDPLNRLTNMIDAAGTTKYGYDAVGQLQSEDGPWTSDTVSFGYNNRLRSSLSLEQPNAAAWTQTYNFDTARRLTSTASSAGNFSYTYDGSRKLQVGTLLLPNSAFITNTFDSNARLLSTTLQNNGSNTLNSHSYTYNHRNERTQQVLTAGNYVSYGYDDIGQLTSAQGKEAGGVTNRLQEQLSYGYDVAHNLNSRTQNALVQTFNANNLNELTTVTRNSTNALTVAGTTTSAATNVTVNGAGATLYSDYTFASTSGFTLTNGNNSFTAIAKDSYGRQDTNTVTVNLPASSSCTYDLNGNLLSDGKRGFDYDDENQLTRVTITNVSKTEFTYDGKGRLRIRKEYTPWLASFILTNEVHYIYDGTLVIQERGINNVPTASYTRGTELSGSFQGAGGIGGLLARTDQTQISPSHAFYHADGNGNITALVNSLQVLVAKYLYDPFGNILSQSGSLADANMYRFSSKEWHPNSGLIYYLYRFYDPNLQRWLNRDPIAEDGGLDLFCFVGNNPVDRIDFRGCQIGVTEVGSTSVLDGPGVAPVPGLTTAAETGAAVEAAGGGAAVGTVVTIGTGPGLLIVGAATAAVYVVGDKTGLTDKISDWLVPQPAYDPSPLPLPLFPRSRPKPEPAPNSQPRAESKPQMDPAPDPIRLPKDIDPGFSKAQGECIEELDKYNEACEKRGAPSLSSEERLQAYKKCMKRKGYSID